MTRLTVWHDGACPLCRREDPLLEPGRAVLARADALYLLNDYPKAIETSRQRGCSSFGSGEASTGRV